MLAGPSEDSLGAQYIGNPSQPHARPADSPPGKVALGACPFPLQPGPSRPAALPA